jgi:hypothetical protein
MNKTNNNKIILSFKILSVLAFSLLIIPAKAFATAGYVDNPTPYISSISPNSINNTESNLVIAITGNGFIPSSVARVNGADRPTTFIDYSHILIRINSNDTYNTDGFYINVFNGFPGGGYSNAELFTVVNVTPVASTNNNQSSTITRNTTNTGNNTNSNTNNTYSTNTNQTENTTNSNSDNVNNSNTDKNSSNLGATAIFGSTGSFLPSGLIQWILFAIVILLIVIIVRRIFGADAKYNQSPMKHA